MKKGIVINQTIQLILAILALMAIAIAYFFLSGMGEEWIDAIRQAMALNTPGA